jgi:protein O-mannosyl-transferase
LNTTTNKKYTYLVIIFLIIACGTAFIRIADNDFIDFDDMKYITQNHNIKSGFNSNSIKWAFTSVIVGNWHPVTMLSHIMDWSLFGTNPAGHHLVSLLLHIGAVIFLFLFLNKTTNNLWPSAFAAALFALHPLRVESVAWAAERKDVLSLFFGMACIYAYAFYVERSKLTLYFLSLILFILALMSKPMLVTLPFILMLLDYWPLKRWQGKMHSPSINRLIGEKVPFILLAVASSVITLWAQNKDKLVIPLDRLPFIDCLTNAIVSYVAYLGEIFWPVNMTVFYPFDYSLPLWKVLISGILLIVMTLAVLYYMKKRPFLFVGWFWYLGAMVPVIGLVKVGNFSMADRYTYLPSIGIMMMLLWSVPLLFPRKETIIKILFPAGSVVLIILGVLTWHQCGYWKNSFELWNHAAKVTKDNYLAHNNLANALVSAAKYEDALNHYNECIRIKPGCAEPYSNRGNLYYIISQKQRAIEDYNEAIRLKPDCVNAYYNRGLVYLSQANNFGCSDAQKSCSLGDCRLLKIAKKKGLCL